jgi:hypothetical protein
MVDEVDLVLQTQPWALALPVAAKSALKLSYLIQYHTIQLQHKGLVSMCASLFVIIRSS